MTYSVKKYYFKKYDVCIKGSNKFRLASRVLGEELKFNFKRNVEALNKALVEYHWNRRIDWLDIILILHPIDEYIPLSIVIQ